VEYFCFGCRLWYCRYHFYWCGKRWINDKATKRLAVGYWSVTTRVISWDQCSRALIGTGNHWSQLTRFFYLQQQDSAQHAQVFSTQHWAVLHSHLHSSLVIISPHSVQLYRQALSTAPLHRLD
jgi:hypothetical protein